MNKNKKGFTILETILSVAIFSALMVIVFHCWMEFQKASIKNEGKQDTNIQFVKIYRNIDKYVSSSNSRLFRYYGNFGTGGNNIKWFAFMLSRDNHQLDGKVVYRSPGNKSYKRDDDDPDNELPRCMVYNTCVYYLLYQKPGCCKDSFENCPHKTLYRWIEEVSEPGFFWGDGNANPVGEFNEWLKGYVLSTNWGMNNKLEGYAVENNIVDLNITKEDRKIRFDLILLRIYDARRHFEIGSKNLIEPEDDEVKKYIETLSWISVPNNY